MTPTRLESLSSKLSSSDCLLTDLSHNDDYLHDATEEHGRPSAVVIARSERDVVATLEYCFENRIAVVPRGAGTGLSGGCVPADGSVVLSTAQIDHIDIDAAGSLAVCGPGAITKDIQDLAANVGLTYPPDPASYAESTIGGNIAEGAGGLRCKRYGVTKDYLIGLRAVTIDGQLIKTGYFSEDEAFYIGDVLTGSEGTLTVLTEVAVRLIPLPPRGITILVAFDKPANAAKTVSDINSAGMVPLVMEFLDGGAVACSNEYEKAEGLDESVAGMLLLETDGHQMERQAEAIEAICRKNGCSYITREQDPDRAENLWKVRRNISNAIKAASKARYSEDVAVPNSKFPDLVAFVAEMNARSPLRIHSFGHAGDGNLHVNFLSSSGSTEETTLIEKGIETVLKKALELGGTLSGEHGIGTAKRDYLHLEFDPPTLHAMKAFKIVFDPLGLLNPGKIFSEK